MRYEVVIEIYKVITVKWENPNLRYEVQLQSPLHEKVANVRNVRYQVTIVRNKVAIARNEIFNLRYIVLTVKYKNANLR